MPASHQKHNPLLWLALLAAIAMAFLWRPQAQAQNGMGRAAQYTYAIVQFRGNDAIVHIEDGSHFYEGPDVLKEERVIGNNNLRLVPVIQLTHLNKLGQEGWEVVRPWGTSGNSWLIQHRVGN